MQSKNLPIGYWIKQADELLTKGIDGIQLSFGITRTGWQILNAVHEKNLMDKVELISLMRPFADAGTVEELLTRFKAEVLINEDPQEISLTEDGMKLHKACLEKQKIFRQQVMTGISEEDYQISILTLQKIVDNINNLGSE
jgi:DNA-binding MarR family transcriptional regulator